MPEERSPEQLEELAANEIKQLKKDYLTAFSSEAGKKVLTHLENLCFINKTTFSSTEGRTLFNEGMRFVVVHIKNMQNFDFKKLQELTKGD